MEDVKGWLTSKTIWGVIISVLGKIVAAKFGYEITEDISAGLADYIATLAGAIISFIGDGMAIYGRVKATKKIDKA